MIKKFASISMALLLSACASSMPNTVSYQINATAYAPENRIIYKNNGSDCEIIRGSWLGSYTNRVFRPEEKFTCVVKPERTIPEEITIEYAHWTTMNQEYLQYYVIQNLPDSELSDLAWRKITLHPNDLVEKYKKLIPEYPAEADKDYSKGKKLNYLIQLNPDGTYIVEDRLEWMHPYTKATAPKSHPLYFTGLLIAIFFGGSWQ